MAPPIVTVGIVTWNSATEIETCLRAVRAQTWPSLEVLIGDNASVDGTRASLARLASPGEVLAFEANHGFAVAHNVLIEQSRGAFYLCLNPDVTLQPDYIERLVEALEACQSAGSATGKLLRASPPDALDSTGIVMTPSQRHLDRGADEPDRGQYDRPEEIFGPSGAAALYRRAMLDDVKVMDEYFDEDFFAYREDADLAWRARLGGWTSLYVPGARAVHGRRVTPERRGQLPPELNRYSVRNRFLLRLKNQPLGHALRFLGPALVRDAQVVGYVLLWEWTSLPALVDVVRLFPRAWRKRRVIMKRRRIGSGELARWFTGERAVSSPP